jgi:hypothetical protein
VRGLFFSRTRPTTGHALARLVIPAKRSTAFDTVCFLARLYQTLSAKLFFGLVLEMAIVLPLGQLLTAPNTETVRASHQDAAAAAQAVDAGLNVMARAAGPLGRLRLRDDPVIAFPATVAQTRI